MNFKILLDQYDFMKDAAEEYDQEIEVISNRDRYKEKTEALCRFSFRGLGKLSAISLVAELGDIRRFSSPGQLTSFAGMDVKEYSSGGKEKNSVLQRWETKEFEQ